MSSRRYERNVKAARSKIDYNCNDVSIDIAVLGKHYTNLDKLKADLKDKKDIEWQGLIYANAECLLSQMGRFQKFTFGARTYTSYSDFFVRDKYYVAADVQWIKNIVNNDQYGFPDYSSSYTPVSMIIGINNIGDVGIFDD